MKLSTRSRYGFRALVELAAEHGNNPVQIKTIAQRQDISNKYLEQLVAILKAAGLVRSVRGPKGGYILAKPPDQISLAEIFSILEGPVVTVDCVEHPEYCPRCSGCVTRQVWTEIHKAIFTVLEKQNLQDLVDRMKSPDQKNIYHI